MVSEPKGVALELSSHFSCTESIQDEAFRPDFASISPRFPSFSIREVAPHAAGEAVSRRMCGVKPCICGRRASWRRCGVSVRRSLKVKGFRDLEDGHKSM